MKPARCRIVPRLLVVCWILPASLLAPPLVRSETYEVVIYTEPRAILFPTIGSDSPHPGVMPIDSIGFAPRCALREVLDGIGCIGLEKQVYKLREGDTLDVCNRWVYDEICSRAYVLQISDSLASPSDSRASVKARLLANACVDSVADARSSTTNGGSGYPVLLSSLDIPLPDSTAKGAVTLSLNVSPWGTVSAASIEDSELSEPRTRAVLEAARRFMFRPARDGCARVPCRISIPLFFGDRAAREWPAR
jgi:TonB family protein